MKCSSCGSNNIEIYHNLLTDETGCRCVDCKHEGPPPTDIVIVESTGNSSADGVEVVI